MLSGFFDINHDVLESLVSFINISGKMKILLQNVN